MYQISRLSWMQATKVGHRLENDVLVVISLQAQPFRKSKMVEGEGGGG